MAPKERFLRAFTPNNTNPNTIIPTCMMHWRIIAAVMIRIMQLERSLAMKSIVFRMCSSGNDFHDFHAVTFVWSSEISTVLLA